VFSHLVNPHVSHKPTCTLLNCSVILITASPLTSPLIPLTFLLYITSHLFLPLLGAVGRVSLTCTQDSDTSVSPALQRAWGTSAWARWGVRWLDSSRSQEAGNTNWQLKPEGGEEGTLLFCAFSYLLALSKANSETDELW